MATDTQAQDRAGSEMPRARHVSRIRLSHVWVVAVISLAVIVVSSSPLVSLDLAYQVRAGQIMLSTHHLLRTDVLTFSAFGRPWLNQQWGPQVLVALAYRGWGWFGLALLRAGLIAGTLWLEFLACRAAGATRRIAAGLTFLSALVLAGGFQLRAQLFGMVCFAAAIWLVANRSRHPRRLWLVVPVVIAWTNLHGSFFLGPLLLGLAWVEDRRRKPNLARLEVWIGGAALLSTIVNPFGPRVWEYVSDISTNPLIRNSVEEWAPPSIRNYPGVMFFASVSLVAVVMARRREPSSWPTLLTLGVFLAIGLSSVRGIFWWGMAAPVVLAGLPSSDGRPSRPRPDPATSLNAVLIGVLLLVVCGTFLHWLPFRGETPPPKLVSFAPTGITAELEHVLEPGERLFDPQEWGSWFELEFPKNPVLVDSRWEVVPVSTWNQYGDVSDGREGWQQIVDRWDIRVMVLSREQQRGLISVIGNDPGWHLDYQDKEGLIFTRG